MNRKGNLSVEEGSHSMDNADKVLEARINEIEKRLNMFQAMVMRGKVRFKLEKRQTPSIGF